MDFGGTKSLCICCLHYGNLIAPVVCSEYQDDIETLNGSFTVPHNITWPLSICWVCRAMLTKIRKFKQQVKESLYALEHHLLQDVLERDQIEGTRITHWLQLKVSDVSVTSHPSQHTEHTCKRDKKNIRKHSKELLQKSIKVEIAEESDAGGEEIIPKAKEEVSCEEQETGSASEGRDAGDKVVRVELTHAQLAEERALAARQPRYLALPYKCRSCILGFDFEPTLLYHQRRYHSRAGDGRLTCATCDVTLGSAASFALHCRRHLVRYDCAQCGKRAGDKYSILRHCDLAHPRPADPAPLYRCDVCTHTAKSYRAYRYHKEKHRQRPQCVHCGNTFINETTLRRHIIVVHSSASAGPRYQCRECPKQFRSRSGLSMHAEQHCGGDGGGDELLYCAPCRAHFKTRYTLAAHLRTARAHAQPQHYRFVCQECDARFLHKRDLVRHIHWKHLDSADFTCDACTKRFPDSRSLRRHRSAVHEKRRPPRDKICQYCARAFTSARILETHVRTHTGERPLVCAHAHCSATFAHPAALYTHTKLVHKLRPTVAPPTAAPPAAAPSASSTAAGNAPTCS